MRGVARNSGCRTPMLELSMLAGTATGAGASKKDQKPCNGGGGKWAGRGVDPTVMDE